MHIRTVHLHFFNGEIWLPQNICGNSNLCDVTELTGIPGNEVILPVLRRKVKNVITNFNTTQNLEI